MQEAITYVLNEKISRTYYNLHKLCLTLPVYAARFSRKTTPLSAKAISAYMRGSCHLIEHIGGMIHWMPHEL